MTIDASSLNIDVQEGERWRRTVSVTVPASAVSEERRKIAARLATRLKLPGFRSGKVPAAVIEQRYGSALNRELLDQVVGDVYKEALRVHDLKPISEGEVQDLDWKPEEDLVFSISFDVQPEFDLSRVGGFAVERRKVEVSAEEVERVLDRLRDQNGEWAPAEEGRAENGDLVSVTVSRLENGEVLGDPQDYDLLLGEGDAIPDVEAAIATLAPGEEGTFVVTFPDDFPNEERRGEQEELRIELRERKIRVLPELDDAFASSVGDFADLDELKARVKEDLGREAENQVESEIRARLVDFVAEANPFEIPTSMVDRYVDSVVGGNREQMDEEVMSRVREQMRPEAERAVRRILIVEKIGETQGLRATEEELDDRIEQIAERSGADVSKVYADLQKSGRIEELERTITEQKVFDFLKEQSTITDAS
ncbi:MAG TPA: trigger factor [Longimicrobiales bacterium]|nr:trigger factor [Longimicrobiales bacterium]